MSINQDDEQAPPYAQQPTPTTNFVPRLPTPAPVQRPVAPPPSFMQQQVLAPAVVSAKAPSKGRLLRLFVWLVVLAGFGAGGVFVYQRIHSQKSGRAAAPPARSATGNSSPTSGTTAGAGGTAVLPDLTFVKPAHRVISYVHTVHTVGVRAGNPTTDDVVYTAEIDYVTPIASLQIDETGTEHTFHQQVITTADSKYVPGKLPGAPWERSEHTVAATSVDSPAQIKVYQDEVTPQLRAAATNVTIHADSVDGVPVTIYEFDVPLTTLADFTEDPADLAAVEATLSQDLLQVHLTIGIDKDGLIRLDDVQQNEAAWRKALSLSPKDDSLDVHDHFEVTATSETPSTVTVPTGAIDAPTTTESAADLCATDKVVMQSAMESWAADKGGTKPPTEAELVTGGYLKHESFLYDISPRGDIVPAPAGGCP